MVGRGRISKQVEGKWDWEHWSHQGPRVQRGQDIRLFHSNWDWEHLGPEIKIWKCLDLGSKLGWDLEKPWSRVQDLRMPWFHTPALELRLVSSRWGLGECLSPEFDVDLGDRISKFVLCWMWVDLGPKFRAR